MNVPVLILAYQRDEHLQRCLDSLISLGASPLYISQDGSAERRTDSWLATLDLISKYKQLGLIQEFQVLDRNYGTLEGVQQGISWFLEHEKFGLIIEDDIVLHGTALLDASRLFKRMFADTRVAGINLYPALPQMFRSKLATGSYRYSIFSNSFAWGTTSEKWNQRQNCTDLRSILKVGKYLQKKVGLNIALGWVFYLIEERFRETFFSKEYKRIGNWDIRWTSTLFLNSWYALVMNSNNVENIGWDGLSTHTKIPTAEDLQNLALDFGRRAWLDPIDDFPNSVFDQASMNRFNLIRKVRSIIALRSKIYRIRLFIYRIAHHHK